jgi:integrase
VEALWLKQSGSETRDKQISAALAGLRGIGPKDELEGMMAAQLIAAHNAAMECYRRAMISEQHPEGRRENLTQANKLSRTYATLLEALNRHRGKGQQKVTVEHVHVHSGGQAVYAADLRIFERWCGAQGLCPMPASPATVAAFLADQVQAGMKPSTLGRRLAALKHAHKAAGEDSPTDDERVKAVLNGARRTLGVAPRKLAAATSEKTIGMATLVRPGLAGLRDRAILLLAFSLAARRSELVALDVEDIEECPEGLRVRIRKSKTDQEGVGVAVCRGSIGDPVAAVLDYIKAAGITSGPVFRRIRRGDHITDHPLGAQTICKLVKDHAEAGPRSEAIRRPQHAGRISDLCGGEGSQSLQDDGCQPA